MPRPPKCRRVCHLPQNTAFTPLQESSKGSVIILTVDEYEAIRLIDQLGLSQEACSSYMQVARTTVQMIYASARKKLADALVNGLPLKIQGGDYALCDGTGPTCGFSGCWKRQTHLQPPRSKPTGGNIMKIAVTYENGQVFQHFGHTAQFKIYDTAEGKVTGSVVVDTNGSGHGALSGFLSGLGVDTLICGGIGGGARMALADAGIRIFGGAFGNADEAVDALLAGSLNFDPNATCSHHGESHTCGDHGCGRQSCGEK